MDSSLVKHEFSVCKVDLPETDTKKQGKEFVIQEAEEHMNFPYITTSKEETVTQSSTKKPQNPPDESSPSNSSDDNELYFEKKVYGNYSLTGKHVLDESDYKYIQIPNTLFIDMHINSCQYQLHQQFPTVNAFQDTTYGTTLTFSKIKHPFTQILHDGKCHWVTVSTIGCKANEVIF